MEKRKKSEIDNEIRTAGMAHVNTDGLIAINGNTFVGETKVDGAVRFFEIKVVAKADTFDNGSVEALLIERKEVEARKAEVKAKAEKKKTKDAEKRAKADAEKANKA